MITREWRDQEQYVCERCGKTSFFKVNMESHEGSHEGSAVKARAKSKGEVKGGASEVVVPEADPVAEPPVAEPSAAIPSEPPATNEGSA